MDLEESHREDRRLQRRLSQARLRQRACVEDLDFSARRKLDRSLVLSLADCLWIKEGRNLILTGATGVGKSYLACALGHRACLRGFSVRYARISRLFEELKLAHGDGTYPKLLNRLAKTDLLILDDWGLKALGEAERNDLLEIIEDRHGDRSTLIAGQLPVDHWHEVIGNPTLADAILDRIIHNAYRINLEGDSMRKKKR